MLLGEFLERVPEGTDADFADANALYMALPLKKLDKDGFCMLYRVEKLLEMDIFGSLRDTVEEYEKRCRKKPYFVDSVKGVHEYAVAEAIEVILAKKLEHLRKVFAGKEASEMNAVEKLCAVVDASEDMLLVFDDVLAMPMREAGKGWCIQSFVTGEVVPVAEAENICEWNTGMGLEFLIGMDAYDVQAVKLLDIRELL